MYLNLKKFKLAQAKSCLSTSELSKKSGLGTNTIWKIISGKSVARPKTIGKLAKALNINVEELIKDDEKS
jgi:transcriptional regulator with XRE-family HTH domain